jgi:hypothetical protein
MMAIYGNAHYRSRFRSHKSQEIDASPVSLCFCTAMTLSSLGVDCNPLDIISLSLQRLQSHFCRREKGSSTEPKGRQFEDSKHDLALDPYVVTCTFYA